MINPISRAGFLRLAAMSALLVIPKQARSGDGEITRDMILNDPDAPVAGNPDGDLTIVDFFDYNCPYCKMAAKSLEKIVKADGNIRLVYKDWPILAETSIVGARLALAAKYQDRYLPVHHALMDIPGYGISQEQMLEAVNKLWRRRTLAWQSAFEAWSARVPIEVDRGALREEVSERAARIAQQLQYRGKPADLAERLAIEQALELRGYLRRQIGGWC